MPSTGHLLDTQPAERIVVAGDSAGGGMTMAMLLSLREAGDAMPAAAYLLSPWLDLTASGDSASTRASDRPDVRRQGNAKSGGALCAAGAAARPTRLARLRGPEGFATDVHTGGGRGNSALGFNVAWPNG